MMDGTRNSHFPRRLVAGLLGTSIALLLWHFISVGVGSPLILPDPAEVLQKIRILFHSHGFWTAVAGSFKRVAWAFGLSIAAGGLTGLLSGLYPLIKDILAPIMTTIRSTPVLALILVAMFWLPSGYVPIFSAFLMAYPIMHTSLYSGMVSTEKELLEMAAVFKVPPVVQFFNLRLPSARRYFLSGMKNTLGLCWKVVVAGEVLSQPRFALGTGMQDARLSLETSSVFAWAITTVLLCGLSEFLLGIAVKRFSGGREEAKA
jgi:NitT/TauT family transport system permease protein